MTLLPIFLLRELGLSPAAMGVIFSLGAVGGLLGAIATPHIVRRIGEARAIPVSVDRVQRRRRCSCRSPRSCPQIAFPLLVVQGFVVSFTVLLYNITQVTFRQRITPPRLLGRMNASMRFCVWGVMPIAALRRGRAGHVDRRRADDVDRRRRPAASPACSSIIGPFWSMRDLPGCETAASAPDAAAAGHARTDRASPSRQRPARPIVKHDRTHPVDRHRDTADDDHAGSHPRLLRRSSPTPTGSRSG